MALANYADLKQVIGRFSHRSDLADVIDDFVTLAEDRIDAELKLRDNELRATATATVDTRFLALPSSFYKMRSLTITKESDATDETEGAVSPCFYQTPQGMHEYKRTTPGRPQYFTVTSQLEFERPFDYAYKIEMEYFSRLAPLTSSNTTNDVLTNYPTLYFYGCMIFLAEFEKDTEQLIKYDQLFDKAMAKANKQERNGRYGPVKRMITMGPTP
jgi:hypothetical protein